MSLVDRKSDFSSHPNFFRTENFFQNHERQKNNFIRTNFFHEIIWRVENQPPAKSRNNNRAGEEETH